MCRVAILLTLLPFLLPFASVDAHEPEDGEIVRSIQIIVRDDIAHVRIAIGINDNTLSDVLVKLEGKESQSKDLSRDDKIAKLEKLLPDYVVKQIALTQNRKTMAHGKIDLQQTGIHHERFVIQAQYQLEKAEKFVELKLKDNLFDSFPGPIRYAIRPRGRAIITNANVAPVLARAKPFKNEDVKKPESKRLIAAKLKIIAKSKNK